MIKVTESIISKEYGVSKLLIETPSGKKISMEVTDDGELQVFFRNSDFKRFDLCLNDDLKMNTEQKIVTITK